MRRTAVIDLGSNSFRLVVFDWEPGGPWTLSDEIREPVRISAGMGDEGLLLPDAIERGVSTADAFASFCRAAGIEDVITAGTSAIRDARNRDDLLEAIAERSGLEVRVLAGAEEAYYGYLAAVNSTTLTDGFAIDMGGGSIQLSRVADRLLRDAESLPLGAVRVTERFLPNEDAPAKAMKELREHVAERIEALGWWGGVPRLVGIGGSIRNLAAAAQKAGGFPDSGVQGFALAREMLEGLVEELAGRPASKRGKVPGIKPDRGDVILGAALVLAAAMDAGGFEALEVSDAGLREGIFFERFLGGAHPALVDDVRRQSVDNLARRYGATDAHVRHVETLSLELYDGLARTGVIDGGAADRELLARACTLHDIGVAVDYDDHHKHSRYPILSAGLPGYDQREVELISLIARYHRKGEPDASALGALAEEGDQDRLALLAGIIRVAEQFERSRDQSVRGLSVSAPDGKVMVQALAGAHGAIGIWSARRVADLLSRAVGRPVAIDPA
jgi:exopolyphosphatase / guanosine-5'-triphosphate,3'-diphosphate pyrophosphatase